MRVDPMMSILEEDSVSFSVQIAFVRVVNRLFCQHRRTQTSKAAPAGFEAILSMLVGP
jgi:hypothetical protein